MQLMICCGKLKTKQIAEASFASCIGAYGAANGITNDRDRID